MGTGVERERYSNLFKNLVPSQQITTVFSLLDAWVEEQRFVPAEPEVPRNSGKTRATQVISKKFNVKSAAPRKALCVRVAKPFETSD